MVEYEYEFEKYIIGTDIKNNMLHYGVGIIPQLLDEEGIQIMIDGMWDNLAYLTQNLENDKIIKDKPETYKNISKCGIKHSMLIQHYGIGHADSCWKIRTHPNILNVFSDIWETDDLVSSFDGVSYNIQSTVKKPTKSQIKFKFHLDQNPKNSNFKSIQSWVTAYDIHEGYGTLIVLEGSNNYHKDFYDEFNIDSKGDWFILEEHHVKWYISKGCKMVAMKCPAGSMVLWDSRTVHCGLPPQTLQQVPRCIHYICMIPKNRCSAAIIKKRIKAFETTRTTSHYPANPKLFPDLPRSYGNTLPDIKKIHRTVNNDTIKKLVGY